MGALSPIHLMVVALVVLLVFGPRKLPELARGIGESMKELKHSLHGVSESEEARLVQEVGRTVQDLKEAVNPLTPPVRKSESG
jgi:TatA/E family protein of Tat protein translocase